MSLVFPASKWTTGLWERHVDRFPSAQVLLDEGAARQAQFPGFAQSTHDALYLRHVPPAQEEAPDWATTLLEEAQQLPEWHTLRARCQANGFTSGIGAERILQALIPLLPQEEEKPAKPDGAPGPQDGPGDGTGTGGRPGGPQGQQPNPDDGSGTRRAVRQACREAAQTIDQAEQATDALGAALGRQQGHGPGSRESLKDLDDVRALYALVRQNKELAHIAELAGRLQRLGQAHKKTLVAPAVGSIKGVTLGGDLERLLPSELAGLRSSSKLLKLQTLDKIMNKRALQYLWRGVDSLTRGPLIVMCDESGSMGNGVGSAGAWSKAVCLSLLTTAVQHKRAFHLIGFSGHSRHSPWEYAINHELHAEPGSPASVETVCAALLWQCGGGTSFNAPLRRALETLRTSTTMRHSDLIFLTDGEADVSPDMTEAMQRLRTTDGVACYVILVGEGASGTSLAPIATAMWHVSANAQAEPGRIAPLLAKVS